MRVLVTGANGFIGRHITAALLGAGHDVVAAVRDVDGIRRLLPGTSAVAVDMNRDLPAEIWAPRLNDVDVVVNCPRLPSYPADRPRDLYGSLSAPP